jgi:hypothetical protein
MDMIADRPVLNRPVWEPRDIARYLFLGGLAGASSALGARAHATGRNEVASARQEMTDKALAARPAAAMLGGAAVLAKAGTAELQLVGPPVPERTVEGVKADVAAVTEATSS